VTELGQGSLREELLQRGYLLLRELKLLHAFENDRDKKPKQNDE
jgi:hypothetical protein